MKGRLTALTKGLTAGPARQRSSSEADRLVGIWPKNVTCLSQVCEHANKRLRRSGVRTCPVTPCVPACRDGCWFCRYCHQHRMPGAAYDVQSSTSSTATHLQKPVKGHSAKPNGARSIQSREGNISGAVARSAVFKMRSKGTEVTQDVANELVAGFSARQFQEALKDCVAADNQC
jgi:hypothetical protein